MNLDFRDETAPSDPVSRAWLVTFTDLISLMLTFFVMLFAMSSIKVDQWKSVTDALSRTLNPTLEKTVRAPAVSFNIGSIFRRRAVNLDYLESVLKETISRDPLLEKSQFVRQDDRLVIALPADLLFEPGRAVMTEKARAGLFVLGGALSNIGNQVGVVGHTDPQAPSGNEYTSNWELSLARAVAVANDLVRAGYKEDLLALGYADTRYHQIPESVGAEVRRTMGRRVDVIVLSTAAVK